MFVQETLAVGGIFSLGSSTGGSGSTIGGVTYCNLIDTDHLSQSLSLTNTVKVESHEIIKSVVLFFDLINFQLSKNSYKTILQSTSFQLATHI